MKEINTLKELFDYADSCHWGLKGKRVGGDRTFYCFITPFGNHVSVEVDKDGNVSSWGDDHNP
jgi:hypothetical protein